MTGSSIRRRYLRPRIAVVVSGWPRVSETFALNELLALREAGLLGAVFATKPGDPSLRQPGCGVLADLVHLLPDGPVAEQAVLVAKTVVALGLDGVHGYFAHQPAAVAADAARLSGMRYGFSSHALDVRKVAADVLASRAAGAAVVVACNRDVAASLASVGATPQLLPHGVDLVRFACTPRGVGRPLEVLAVGRLVEKKGFTHLVRAVAACRADVRLTIVGDGPDRAVLEPLAHGAGCADRVTLLGRRTHDELPSLYARADVVAVPSVIDRNGDRDGLPNVVLEAMASGRPVVASDVAAVATAVTDGETGLLVPAGDPTALAAALDRLAASPAERARLGRAARVEVERRFDLRRCAAAFCNLLEASYG